jgi:hypothetical protein
VTTIRAFTRTHHSSALTSGPMTYSSAHISGLQFHGHREVDMVVGFAVTPIHREGAIEIDWAAEAALWADESLKIANETFSAVAECWPAE